jgi:hypothetical protein
MPPRFDGDGVAHNLHQFGIIDSGAQGGAQVDFVIA